MSKNKCCITAKTDTCFIFAWEDGYTTNWPIDIDNFADKIRYGQPSENDLSLAASFIDAYGKLINLSQKKRNFICGELKKQIKNNK